MMLFVVGLINVEYVSDCFVMFCVFIKCLRIFFEWFLDIFIMVILEIFFGVVSVKMVFFVISCFCFEIFLI